VWCSFVLMIAPLPAFSPFRAFAQSYLVVSACINSPIHGCLLSFLLFFRLWGTLPLVDQPAHILLEKAITSD
jgi:hypothetical protein